MLKAKEVASILGVATRTVYTLPIPCYRFGTAVRYAANDVEAYKQSYRTRSKHWRGIQRFSASHISDF